MHTPGVRTQDSFLVLFLFVEAAPRHDETRNTQKNSICAPSPFFCFAFVFADSRFVFVFALSPLCPSTLCRRKPRVEVQLFYTSEASIQSHVEHLDDLGVEQMTYANHEAVPYREDVCDYFCEVDMFRVNHLTLPLSRSVGESTRFWRRRTGHGQYMLAYDNGKAAVKVLPGKIVPQSVHRWRTLRPSERDCNPIGQGASHISSNPIGQSAAADVPDATSPPEGKEVGREESASNCEGADGSTQSVVQKNNPKEGEKIDRPSRSGGHLVNRSALPDPRELRLDEFLECSDPCILHYPSCGLDWLRDKYLLLGSFPSSWFGGNLPIAPSFHLDARNAARDDVAPAPSGSKGGEGTEEDRSRELYRKEVMLSFEEHAEEARAQLDHGVLRIITEPARVIDRARNALREAPGSRVTPATLSATTKGGAQQPHGGVEEGSAGRTERDGGASAALAAAMRGRSGVPISSSASGTATGDSGSNSTTAAGLAKKEDSVENVAAAADFENSWIMAACLREFL